jgi:hypothetical protein
MTQSNKRAGASRGDFPPAAPEEPAAGLPELIGVPMQACLIGFSAWARYSSAVVEALGRYEAGLAEAGFTADRDGGLSPLRDRAFVDETRALLRRMGEAASLEARRAQLELEKVGESIARAAAAAEGGVDPEAPPVRRHEVKA